MQKLDLPVDPSLSVERHCRVCGSQFVSYLRHVPLQRIGLHTPLYYCMECESFLHPQIYREPIDQLERDAQWHVSVESRNQGWANTFFDEALKMREIKSVVEIGCGTGSFLSVAKARGIKVYGHDTNPYVGQIAYERHGIAVDKELWNAQSEQNCDLVVCISTFEHITTPFDLMMEISAYCKRTGASAYVSVPFATERHQWTSLIEQEIPVSGNPLYLSDVHITHFSKKGFEYMAHKSGARGVVYFKHGWMGYWLDY